MKELLYPYNQQYIPVCEEVYGRGYDTAGNYHWHGTYTGHHVIKKVTINEGGDCMENVLRKCCGTRSKQQAKKIVRKQCKKEHEDETIDYFAEWYCPHCNSLILRGFDNPSIKFCYKCGKSVLW